LAGTSAASTPEAEAKTRGGADKRVAIDFVLAAVIGLAVLLVHDVPYVLHHPYWLDEAWVADSARAPLSQLPHLTASSPIGWTFLLHIVPLGGEQRQRIVPILFAGLAAAAAYLFGRELRLGRFTTGLLTGAAVLLSPALLAENDLKQYTAEAFMAVVVWICVARVENEWGRRRLAALAAAGSFGVLLGSTVIFTAVAAVGALGLECLIRRQYRRLAELAVAAVGMLAVFGVFYLVLLRSGDNAAMVSYWDPYYVPLHLGPALTFVTTHFTWLVPQLGFGWLWLDLVLGLAGVVALVLLGRIALAALLPFTLLVVIVASAAKIYPFGDARTSTFWTSVFPLLSAVAVAALCHWLARRGGLGRAGTWLTAVLTAGALAAVTWVNLPLIRAHTDNKEDVRTPIFYVAKHYQPGDVIVVDYGASFGFAYYYPAPATSFPDDPQLATGFVPSYAGKPWIVMMKDRTSASVGQALTQAKAELAREGTRSTGRIWIIRTHMGSAEEDAWQKDLAAGGSVRTYDLSDEPLLLYRPAG
jgi:hypothetical protein